MKDLWPGWNIVEHIGSGGSGKVYKIRKTNDDGSQSVSALKVISVPESDEEFNAYVEEGYDNRAIIEIFYSRVKRIVDEFRLMMSFKDNPNIVSYQEHRIVPHENGKGWDILIRMELLNSLNKHNAKNIMTELDVIKMGIDVCRALEACQTANLIHRDIKPQNIFVNEEGNYKLGDFGISKTMEQTAQATKTGTYTYMAPEVYKGEPYNSTIDIYSLGLVMYWALNEKRLPFLPLPPETPNEEQLNLAQSLRLSGELFPPPKNGSNHLKLAVLTACSPDASKRFQSPEHMRIALEAAIPLIGEDEPTVGIPLVSVANPQPQVQVAQNEEATQALFLNKETPQQPSQFTQQPQQSQQFGQTRPYQPVDETAVQPPESVPTVSEEKKNWLPILGITLSSLSIAGGIVLLILGLI